MTVDELVGMKLSLSIVEPWDFAEDCGGGPFLCSVLQVGYNYWTASYRNQRVEALLLQLQDPFEWQGVRCEYFIAGPRHEGSEVSDIAHGSMVICALTRVSEDNVTSSDPFDLSWWRWREGVGVIGTLREAIQG